MTRPRAALAAAPGIVWQRTSRQSTAEAFGFTLIVCRADMGEWEWRAHDADGCRAKGLANTRRQAGRAAVEWAHGIACLPCADTAPGTCDGGER